MLCFLPFNDDLGTPPTRRPYSWKKRLDEFETAVLEQLPTIGGSSTFGCELTFVQRDTGKLLMNPIWDTLRDCNHFHLVVRQCCCRAEHKGQLKRNAKAIRVPPTRSGQVLPHAFTHMNEVRHVQVEAGLHTIGEAAWQHCNRLLIVHLPNTLVCLKKMAPSVDVMSSTQSLPQSADILGAGCLRSATL